MKRQMLGLSRALLGACCAAAMLAGCAHPQLIDMGQTEEFVTAELGEPNAKTPMPDGTVRWTYSSQPFGQQVWWLFSMPTARLSGVKTGCRKSISR